MNIHAAGGKVNLNEMLWYIDQQISFWYKDPKEIQVEFNLCSDLENRGDVEVYGCDDSSIILYKWDIEYAFTLVNWIYESFDISDSELDSVLKEKLGDCNVFVSLSHEKEYAVATVILEKNS